MRTKQALKNVSASLLLQVVSALSGILLPRFFIGIYGSAVNGLVTSVTQFISYMTLVEAGIGAAGAVALYRPLAEGNDGAISSIVTAAKKFYFRSGLIFVVLVGGLVAFYPFAVASEMEDAGFVRWMICVLAVNGIVDYFFLGKYRVLLTADQRGYVISLAQSVGTVAVTVLSIVMMEWGCSSLAVKSVAAVVYILRSVVVFAYAKRRYPRVSFRAKPDFKSFSQRWAALLHQIVGMVVNNTDVVLLTLLLSTNALEEVSVYGLYNLIVWALVSLMNSIYTGLGSGFGEVIARKETEVLKNSFSSFEYLFFILIFIAFSCMTVLFYPFVGLYSAGFTDGVLYQRWELVILFTASGLIQCLRYPALTLIVAAGHYKQTRWRAIAEAVINIAVSLALIYPFGIAGVIFGTVVSYLYRTVDVIFYSSKHFVPGTRKKTFLRLGVNFFLMAVAVTVGFFLIPQTLSGWFAWVGYACLFGMGCVVLFFGVNLLLEPAAAKAWAGRLKEMFLRK